MKIRSFGAELFCVERETDELTDTTKLKIAFRKYTKAPDVQSLMLCWKIISSCPQIQTKQTNTLCGQNVVLCYAHSLVIAILFNIIKHQIFLSECVPKVCYEETVSILC